MMNGVMLGGDERDGEGECCPNDVTKVNGEWKWRRMIFAGNERWSMGLTEEPFKGSTVMSSILISCSWGWRAD